MQHKTYILKKFLEKFQNILLFSRYQKVVIQNMRNQNRNNEISNIQGKTILWQYEDIKNLYFINLLKVFPVFSFDSQYYATGQLSRDIGIST